MKGTIEMGVTEVYLKIWHGLKLRWHLRGADVLKWQLCNEVLSANKQKYGRRMSEMHPSDPQYYIDRIVSDDASKTTAVADTFRWFTVGQVTLYTKINSVGRPYQVWLYNHRSRCRNLLLEENNPSCTVDIAITRDHKFVTINSNTRTSSEVHVLRASELPLDCLRGSLQLVRKRQPRVEYYVDHAHGQFYVLSNDSGDKEFKVMVGDDDAVSKWKDYYVPTQDVILQDMELYQKYVVLYGLRKLVPVAIIIDAYDRTKQHEMLYDEEGYHMDKPCHDKFESDEFYFWLSSPVKPPFLLTSLKGKQPLDPTLKKISKKAMSPRGFSTKRYVATSKDGCEVPLTVCYRTDLVKLDRSAPSLIHVYGSYGENLRMAYQPEKQPLLDRGWVLVYCHIRGGGELGRKWYYDGMGENKHKGFMDLYACVDYIQSELNISRPELTALVGRSAGALPVSMFCNQWPYKIQAALLQFPLVNLAHSLLDSSSYLSTKDMEEFGGNDGSQQRNNNIRSICPYCSLTTQDYPAMYIAAARYDEIIPFEGVKMYVEKLQRCINQYKGSIINSNPSIALPWRKKSAISRGTVLFSINCSHGHYYRSNEEKYQEASQQYAFLMKVLSTDNY